MPRQRKLSAEEQAAKKSQEDFLALALRRFRFCAEAETKLRQEALDDLKFSMGEQWPKDIESMRNLENRPCITINLLPQFIRQVTNEERQQRPAIQIDPIGDGATKDTAATIQGICRHIEVRSNADIAYDHAYDQTVRMGYFGFWRIITQRVPGKTLNQEILIKKIKNGFSVYFDPRSEEPDFSDAEYCFIVDDCPREEFEHQYPDAAITRNQLSSSGDTAPEWITRDTVRRAEYFYVEREEKKIFQMKSGHLFYEEELPDDTPEESIVATHSVTEKKVCWALITAVDVLEKNEWPGKWIPIIPVVGDEQVIDGKLQRVGLIRFAKSPQQAFNYWSTKATETIALAPTAPYIGAKGQFEGVEEKWRKANITLTPYLEYNPIDVQGKPVGPPQRNAVEPPIQAMSEMIMAARQNLQATIGLNDANLGQRRPDESGKAVLARQRQGDVSTFNFSDNLSRSIRHTGRQLVDLIPKVYDVPQIIRIVNPDQSSKQIAIHVGHEDAEEAAKMKVGDVAAVFDLGVGIYDVTVSVGPSYQSKRQEAVQSIMALIGAYPEILQICGDLLVRSMDWPDAEVIADRLKKMLPPQLQEDPGNDPTAQLQQAKAQLTAIGQQHQQLVNALNDANQIIRTKKLEIESRERIAYVQAQSSIVVAELKARTEAAMQQVDSTLALIQQRLDQLHEHETLDKELQSAESIASMPPAQPPSTPTNPAAAAPAPEGGQ